MTPYYDHGGITIYHGNGSNPSGSLVQEVWDDGEIDWLLPVPCLTFWPASRTAALLARANAIGLTKHRALYMRKLDPKPQVGGRIRWAVEPIWCLSQDGFLLHGGCKRASIPKATRRTQVAYRQNRQRPNPRPILWLRHHAPRRQGSRQTCNRD